MKARVLSGGKELEYILSALGNRVDGAAKMAVYDGAAILKIMIAESLDAAIESNSTGDLEGSLGFSKIRFKAGGGYNTRISFDGYDRRGKPNIVKARVLESGSSRGHQGKGFFRKGVNRGKEAAIAAATATAEKQLNKIIGGK